MTVQIVIVGYEQECNCEHCGRPLKHGIRISDGRVVGATCLDKKLTKPKIYRGQKYRLGSERIIHIAKVVQFKNPSRWDDYGVAPSSPVFEAV
jgi:hypothetical protein